jgi:hypothetical protein
VQTDLAVSGPLGDALYFSEVEGLASLAADRGLDLDGTDGDRNAAGCAAVRFALKVLLEKLYGQLKDRSDIQILSFDIDEDLGLLAPFVKEKGFNFPVIPAYSFVQEFLDVLVIPQN